MFPGIIFFRKYDSISEFNQINKNNTCTRRGYIQKYSGSGKEKTTAALGLSLRTLLSGGSVFFAQFSNE
jgi:ATP:corrinoid adenosyltransferase